jgi:hypothetical protein
VANHGNTPAAWTAVTLIMLGFLVGGVGIVIARPALVVAGVVIIVLGGLVGKIMQMMGLGQRFGQRDYAESGGAE